MEHYNIQPDLEIIDNAIPNFKEIQNIILSREFPWFYNPQVTGGVVDEGQYQYTHTVYESFVPKSKIYDIIAPSLFPLINLKILHRIYINAIPLWERVIANPWHVDVTNGKTATLYLNTNDGQTRFKTGECVDSVENRIAIFNSKTLHTGTTCTKPMRRVVMTVLYDV